MYRAEPKEPTQFGSVSGSEIQNLPFSHSGIVSLYRSEPKEPTQFGSLSGSEIQNICIGRNLAELSLWWLRGPWPSWCSRVRCRCPPTSSRPPRRRPTPPATF